MFEKGWHWRFFQVFFIIFFAQKIQRSRSKLCPVLKKFLSQNVGFYKNTGTFYFFILKKIGEKIIFFQNLSSFQREKNKKIFSREIEKRFWKKNLFLFSPKKILKKESFSFFAKKEFEKRIFFLFSQKRFWKNILFSKSFFVLGRKELLRKEYFADPCWGFSK